MFNRNWRLFLFFMLGLFLCGALLFLNGFFPDAHVNAADVDNTEYGSSRPTKLVKINITPPPKAKYEQIILMIIDAFRFNFIHPSDNERNVMPFVHTHRCSRLKLRVAIPTVTMPRIKSLMTGTISNFIDIIRNLGETQQLDDSLLHVLRAHNRSINFAGDRTWTGLFPTEFERQKANMDSFFVNDFYEGDRQIIATMRKELGEYDWSLFILHFLGLDHIGHVEGSNSPKIKLKLQEMDEFIREMYTYKNLENRLLLVTGDHGMRDGGGHGGSTEEELTVPLLSFSKNCYRNDETSREYNQIDLAATLAILMSVEIPKTSIGRLIPELLQNFSQEERLYAFFYNAHHLLQKANIKYGKRIVEQAGYKSWLEEAKVAHEHFIESSKKQLPGSFYYEQALKNYQRVAEEISEKMSQSLVKFDYGLIGVGVFLTTAVTLNTWTYLIFTERGGGHKQHNTNESKSAWLFNLFLYIMSLTIALIVNVSSQEFDWITVNSFSRNCLFTFLISLGVFMLLGILRVIQKIVLPLPIAARLKFVWSFPKLLLAGYLLTVILLGSSSFIEFEELSWHYLGVTCLLWLIFEHLRQALRHFNSDCESLNKPEIDGKSHLIACLSQQKMDLVFSFIVLIILRLLSVLNATSQRRWAKWLQHLKEPALTLLFIGSLLLLLRRLRRYQNPYLHKASLGAAICILLFHGFQGKVILLPETQLGSLLAFNIFWIFIVIISLADYAFLFSKNGRTLQLLLKNTFVCSILIAALLQQLHNVVLLPCLLLVLEQSYKFCDNLHFHMLQPYKDRYKIACKTFLTILIANMFFFYQGNSNSLATIDLNPGYIGQSSYNPLIVGIFVTLNSYAALINGFLYLCLHIVLPSGGNVGFVGVGGGYYSSISGRSIGNEENLELVLSLYTAATLLPVAFYLVLMILFRYHLFIYSVFAPKVFYECYRVLVYFLMYAGFQMILCFGK